MIRHSKPHKKPVSPLHQDLERMSTMQLMEHIQYSLDMFKEKQRLDNARRVLLK